MSTIFSSIQGWIKQPFNSQGDLVSWALFVGLMLILVFMWTRVLSHITADI